MRLEMHGVGAVGMMRVLRMRGVRRVRLLSLLVAALCMRVRTQLACSLLVLELTKTLVVPVDGTSWLDR